MPHQCVHCSEIYGEGSEEVLKGCSKCGGRFFFYITEEKLKKIQQNEEEISDLTSKEKKQIETDIRDIVGMKDNEEAPIIMDFESIKIIKPGKYLIDLHNLFSKERPLIYKLEDGKYIIDLTAHFGKQSNFKNI